MYSRRFEKTEVRISELEERAIEVMEPKGHCESPRTRREKWAERLSEEIIAENFLNLMTYMNINIQESQQTPSKINSEIHDETHYNQAVERQRILNAARKKQLITHKGPSRRLLADLFLIRRKPGSQKAVTG